MTCKDCFHREACKDRAGYFGDSAGAAHFEKFAKDTDIYCPYFVPGDHVVILPVEIGDTVWFIKSHFQYVKEPMPGVVNMIKTFTRGMTFFTFGALMSKSLTQRKFTGMEIGKTVFLTQAAAVQALKELQIEND